ncbi:hypothetical protein L596_005746 [Steinernema carpocapsae]|uniref:Phosphoacetylglucosamine mutase AMG1 domain-containing protein n=1 Tax=Steinernema carpocapsae TaxID=34508 RepID=A0A4U8V4E2_STECR|nr:hypothetical protein L596_005746 [Steinernema carpocapsae]
MRSYGHENQRQIHIPRCYIRDALRTSPHRYIDTDIVVLLLTIREAKNYDIGVYFESNGHLVFKKPVEQTPAVSRLRRFASLINYAVGDAITNLLAVEALLRYYDWSIEDWDKQLYTPRAAS